MSYQDIYLTCGDDIQGETGHSSSRRGKVERVYAEINTLWGSVADISCRINVEDRKDESYVKSKLSFWKEKNNPKKVKQWEEKLKETIAYNIAQESDEYVTLEVSPAWDIKQLQLQISLGGWEEVKVTKEDLKLIQLIKQKDPEAIKKLCEMFQVSTLEELSAKLVANKV